MLAINQTLQGRYKIVRQLGHGGMGAVYEAIDKRFGEPIALKEIIFDANNEKQSEMIGKAFEREAKSLAKAKHEAVPYVRDYFSELNRQFLVMELVEGDDLGEMLEKRNAPFPVEDVINWMEQLLDALDYLHNLKPSIIHRDIKPQNLKLNARSRIKLLDFGIARSTDKTQTVTKQTFVGATLTYSPIEQILRVIDPTFREFIVLKHKDKAEAILRQDTDARCDLYALGGTFFHLLTNVAPIDATKRTLDLWEGKPDPLPVPSDINPNIPVSISNCLVRAMSIERKKRFATALEMQEALKAAVEESKTKSLELKIKTQADTVILVSNPDLKVNAQTEVLNNPVSTYPPIISDNSTGAKTEVLINPISTLSPAPPNSSDAMRTEVLMNPSISRDPVEIPVLETQVNIPDVSVNEKTFVNSNETQANVNIPNPNLTEVSYLKDVLVEEKKATVKPPVQTIPKVEENNSQPNNKMIWLVPISVVGFLGIIIIGGVLWFLRPTSNASVSNTSISNQSTPSSTPKEIATPTPTHDEIKAGGSGGSLEVTPTPSVTTPTPKTATSKQPEKPAEKPDEKPVLVEKNTPKPPISKPAQSKPAQTKPAQDPRCVLTNSCQ